MRLCCTRRQGEDMRFGMTATTKRLPRKQRLLFTFREKAFAGQAEGCARHPLTRQARMIRHPFLLVPLKALYSFGWHSFFDAPIHSFWFSAFLVQHRPRTTHSLLRWHRRVQRHANGTTARPAIRSLLMCTHDCRPGSLFTPIALSQARTTKLASRTSPVLDRIRRY
jgi:hypothetical protein